MEQLHALKTEEERGRKISEIYYNDEHMMKICVLGNPQKIKTDLLRHYADKKFTINYLLTRGVDITTKKIQIENDSIKLIIADIARQ